MKIGILIGRIGGVDGVALETEKWIQVLEKMGHQVFILSGEFENWKMNPQRDTLEPTMSFFSTSNQYDQQNAFLNYEELPQELIYHIDNYSNIIYESIIDWVDKIKPDLLISENASALPAHLAMGLGIKKAAEFLKIPIITHDHDFAWERGDRYISPFESLNLLVDDIFPLQLPFSYHAVINSYAQQTLKQRFNRDSIVVPNVMDFSKPYAAATDKSKSLRKSLGFETDDILLFQITRIVRRKRIDTAIELINKLNNPKIKLVITGSASDDEGGIYYMELLNQVRFLGLEDQVFFAADKINNLGNSHSFSLEDAYANASACAYFSDYEGFGNAFVEAVLAKRPIFVNNYKPVYWPDIGSKGFKTVMIEDNFLTNNDVEQIKEIIFNDKLNKEIAEYNYQLGKKYFSYETLEEKFAELFKIIFGK